MIISDEEENPVSIAGSSKIQEVVEVTTISDWKIKVEPQEVYSLEPVFQVLAPQSSYISVSLGTFDGKIGISFVIFQNQNNQIIQMAAMCVVVNQHTHGIKWKLMPSQFVTFPGLVRIHFTSSF